jgi:mannosylglycerate hydrolase
MIDVHLISHTHWDREWYLTREQFRLRLVDLVDRVLDLLRGDSGYTCFHLDGQTIVLEDYLEIRPERTEEIRELVRAGRLLVGPWYVMPDEFLVSGESLVRNLALGHRIARSFGGSMPVGYLPDLFGHVGQMPQILRQFDLDNAILWRGFDGPRAEYWWQSPDGSRVLMMHLPPEGYCNALRIALAPDQMVDRTEAVIEREASRTTLGVVLLMNGVDHTEPQDTIPSLVAALQQRSHRIRQSTLPAYVDAVRSRVAGDGSSLEVVRGELRGGEQYAPLLPGVLSARTYLKQANARVQNALERWAEPLSTWAWLLGDAYPTAALQYAWKVLLQNHPHDSICGCSIDAVHDENMSRFARAAQVAEDLIDRASVAIARRVAPAAPGSMRVLFFNTSGWPGARVVEGSVDLPFDSAEPHRHVDPEALDVPVVFYPKGSTITSASLPQGGGVPLQVLDEREVISWVRSRYETPWALHARRVRFAAVIDLPACGYESLDLHVDAPTALPAAGPVTTTPRSLENEILRLTLTDDGTATIFDKRSGKTYAGCGALMDEGDVGDEYNYSPPRMDPIVSSTDLQDVQVAQVDTGPLRGRLRIDAMLSLPRAATADRSGRASEMIGIPVTMEITLDAGSARAAWHVRIDNRAHDHRQRIVFPSGLRDPREAISDTAFGVIARPARREPPAQIRTEAPVSSAPMRSFVALTESYGAAVYTQGLNEYEVLPGNPAGIGITLLRCVGDLSRDDLATRPQGHAGPGLPAPGGQCPGVHEFAVAFEPFDRSPDVLELYTGAASFVTPPRIAIADGAGGNMAPRADILSLAAAPAGVVLSALKKTEDRESLTVRMFNPSAAAARVELTLRGGVQEVRELNLLEEPRKPLAVQAGTATVEISGFGVRTLELAPPPPAPRRAPR